jgi:CubicO group peptidase (beta-lactamase class C family)
MAEAKWMQPITPEEAGIPSGAVTALLERLDSRRIRMNSLMVLRRGRIAAEGYWKPFDREKRHRMYSVSKSMMSVAIGILVTEGKLSLGDRVAGFFPDKLPEKLHPYIADATVRDLLMMATPHETSTYKLVPGDWVSSFFSCPPSHPAGTVFSYDTSGSHVLGALAERISGMPLLDFMRARVFDEIGFSKEAIWMPDPYGVQQAGSGMYCTTRDLARFGLLCLNRGVYQGKRYVAEDYMLAATTKQISNSVPGTQLGTYVMKHRGYGYQFWCGTDDLFCCYGMCGQFALMSPRRDLLAVTTAETQVDPGDEAAIITALWEELFQKAMDAPLPEDKPAARLLERRLASLELLAPQGRASSPLAGKVSGGRWRLEPNPMGISEVTLELTEGGGAFTYLSDIGRKSIRFGWGSWLPQAFPEGGYDCVARAAWADDSSLEIWVSILDETPATLKLLLSFKGDQLSLRMYRAVGDILNRYQGFAGGVRQG